jgi:hypothetical protein
MNFIILFVIIGAIIIGLNQLEKQRKAKKNQSNDIEGSPDTNILGQPRKSEQWVKDQLRIYDLALQLEEQEKQKNPEYIGRIGKLIDFHPLNPRFALVEEVLKEGIGGKPYITEYCVDCLLVENFVVQGGFILFHYAGTETKQDGDKLDLGIAVSAFDKNRNSTMRQVWSELYREAKIAQNEALIKSISESL